MWSRSCLISWVPSKLYTHKGMSFIWIVWSTLYVYLWVPYKILKQDGEIYIIVLSWNNMLAMMNFTYQITFEGCNLNTIVDFINSERNSKLMPHLGLIISYIVSLIMLETLGNFLLFCMIWYEKYGMDSKKRTISNQLMSRMIIVLILFNIIMMPLIMLILIFGALSEYFILT